MSTVSTPTRRDIPTPADAKRPTPLERHPGRESPALWLVRGGIALATVCVRIPSFTEPRWFGDEGVFTAVATGMSNGQTLYAQVFDNSPPGIYWLFRALVGVGALQHHWVVQVAVTDLVVCIALLTFEIARRVASLWPAVLAGSLCAAVLSIPTLDGDLINVEIAALPFFLGALILAFSRRKWAPFLAGVLLGAAVATRPSFAVDSVAMLVPLFGLGSLRWRALAHGIAGVGASLGSIAAVLWIQGSWTGFARGVLPADHTYLLWANGGSTVSIALRLAIFAAAACVALSRSRSPAARLLAVWLPASLAAATLTPREFPHYIHEAIPPLALAFALIAAVPRRRWVAAPLALIGVVATAQLALVLSAQERGLVTDTSAPGFRPNFNWTQLPGYYENWLMYVLDRRSPADYAAWFPAPVARIDAEASAVRGLVRTTAHPTLLVLGDQPWLYVVSGLRAATPYVAIDDQFPQLDGASDKAKLVITCARATVVVVVGRSPSWSSSALEGSPYTPVTGTPWPTYTATGERSASPVCR